MALVLSGECRGVKTKVHKDKTKHYLMIEDEELNMFQVGLGDDQAGFLSSLDSFKGQVISIPIHCGQFNGTVWFSYSGTKSPVRHAQKAAA